MATTYVITAKQVTEAALRKLGVIAQGDTVETTQFNEAMFALNNLAGRLFTMGMPFYKETTVSVTPTIGPTQTLALSSGPLHAVYQAYRRDTSTNIDIPLRVISREEYHNYTNKYQGGIPVAIAMSPDGTSFSSYLAPDATFANGNNAFILYGYVQNDVVSSLSDNMAFPREWSDALVYNLAYNLTLEYGVALDVKNSLKNDADAYLRDAINWNPQPTSIFFGEDTYGRS